MGPRVPTVQQLLDTSCLSGDLKFEEVSVCSSQKKKEALVDLSVFLCTVM